MIQGECRLKLGGAFGSVRIPAKDAVSDLVQACFSRFDTRLGSLMKRPSANRNAITPVYHSANDRRQCRIRLSALDEIPVLRSC